MEQYIPKSSLVAEIEKRIKINKQCMLGLRNLDYYQGKVDALNDFISFLNTLKVKEVDLEKEYEEFVVDDPIFGNFITNDTMGMELAKHFFELGLKAQKGE
jgi:hypothetical protein